MRDDLHRLQQAYQTVLEENFLDKINPFKKKPASQAAPDLIAKQRFHKELDAAATKAGMTRSDSDSAPGSLSYSNEHASIELDPRSVYMRFKKDGKTLETIELSYSTEDIDRAKAFMHGKPYEDPADRPWGLHPSDTRR